VGAADDVVIDDVLCLLEPVEGGAIEDLALVGNGSEVTVEAALPVGGDKQEAAVAEVVGVADLTGIFCG
jgi:hypothetical protein